MSEQRWLITGADGYIGSQLTERLLKAGKPVTAWMRAANESDRNLKKQKLFGILDKTRTLTEKLRLEFGDLTQDAPFSEISPDEIHGIVHTAAATKFNISSEIADSINIGGTKKILDFARSCASLRQFNTIGTVYSSGLNPGKVPEGPVADRTVFANHYERSKCESERMILAEYGDLPWKILRVATILAHDDDGEVVQYNVFHNTMKLLFYGLISVLPGHPDTPIFLVTSRFVTDAIMRCLDEGLPARQFVNISHSAAESLKLGKLIDIAFEEFSNDADFSRKRIMKPLFTYQQAFDDLAKSLNSMSGGIVTQAVSSMIPFAHQLFIAKDFAQDNLRKAYPEYTPPRTEQMVRATIRYLLKSRWGQKLENAT